MVLGRSGDVHAVELRPDGGARAVLVSPHRIDGRLPAGRDAVRLDGLEPTTLDVGAQDPRHPRLRCRGATPDEVRRALGAPG